MPGKTPPQRFGDYELHRLIGIGGMAEVHLARPLSADRERDVVVVKRVLERLRDQPRFVQMFEAEAERGAQLQHANVVRALDRGEQLGWPFMVLEYVHGRNLRQLAAAGDAGRGLPIPLAAYCVAEMLKGLAYTHEAIGADGLPMGLIHRDVTPENICVCFDGSVKLADFGVAHRQGEVERRELRGKFGYLAPEVLEESALDLRSDIFSAGVVLWELLAGRGLYLGETGFEVLFQVHQREPEPPSEHNAEIPAALDQIVVKALMRDPDQRHQSARAFAEELERFLASEHPGLGAARLAEEMLARFDAEAAAAPDLEHAMEAVEAPFDEPEVRLDPELVGASDARAMSMLVALRSSVRSEVMQIEAGVGDEWDTAYESAIVSQAALPPVDEDFADVDTEVQRVGVTVRGRDKPVPLTIDALIALVSSTPEEVVGIGPLGEAALPAADCGRLLYWDALAGMPGLPAQARSQERFADVSLPRLLFEMSVRRMTGSVLLENDSGARQRLLLLRDGLPQYVFSSEGREGALAMLLRFQTLTPGVLFHGLERSVREQEPLECSLVDALCAEGNVLAAEQLPLNISGLIMRRLYPVFGWRGGGFRIYGEQLAPSPFGVPLPSLLGCLVHGARAALKAEELFSSLQGRGNRAVVLSPQRAGHVEALRLNELGQRLVGQIDGERGLLPLLRRAGVERPEQLHYALALIYTLAEARVVELL